MRPSLLVFPTSGPLFELLLSHHISQWMWFQPVKRHVTSEQIVPPCPPNPWYGSAHGVCEHPQWFEAEFGRKFHQPSGASTPGATSARCLPYRSFDRLLATRDGQRSELGRSLFHRRTWRAYALPRLHLLQEGQSPFRDRGGYSRWGQQLDG